ncbi:peroxisome membrane protein [Coemansia spiralis]|nr:peroxisome membrane protein [Coemansia spiralis]
MLQKYASFVLNNAAQVNSIENGLRMLTYILPGRFADAEMASEAIYTLLSFVGVYHDGLLAKAAKAGLLVDKEGKPVEVEATPFNRYHGRLARQSEVYRITSLILSGLQFSEKLIEMAMVKKFGEKTRWRVVSWIEVAKIVLRLNLLQLSGRRMVTGSVIPERLVDPASLGPTKAAHSTLSDGKSASALADAPWKGERSGLRFKAVRDILSQSEGNANLSAFVASEAREPEAISPARTLIRRYNALGLAGELLFILRPLLYVIGIRKLGKSDWRPWALSLLVELASRQMIRTDLHANGESPARTVEKDELSRRKWLFLYYLLRSPFFDRFTESRITRIAEWCNNKPLLSLLGALLQDYLPLWQQYYFYTSAS